MLPHGLHADRVSGGIFDCEIFPRISGYLIGCGLRPPDGDARSKPPDDVHRDTISLRGVVTEPICNPDVRCGFQVRGGWEVDLKMRLEYSDNLRTKGLSLIQGLPDCGGVRAEPPLKVFVTDDRHY